MSETTASTAMTSQVFSVGYEESIAEFVASFNEGDGRVTLLDVNSNPASSGYHGACISVVSRMSGEERSPACEDRVRRVLAALNYFSDVPTEDIERLGELRKTLGGAEKEAQKAAAKRNVAAKKLLDLASRYGGISTVPLGEG